MQDIKYSDFLIIFTNLFQGWGIRTMTDIPFGSFICIYTGVIRKEDDAENSGRTIGDEYFANLNFIESAESCKVEVKRSAHDSGNDETFSHSEEEEDGSFEKSPHKQTEFSRFRLRKRKSKKLKKKEEDTEDKKEESEDSDEEWSKTREYFQTDAENITTEEKTKRIMFVVDAKQQEFLHFL